MLLLLLSLKLFVNVWIRLKMLNKKEKKKQNKWDLMLESDGTQKKL